MRVRGDRPAGVETAVRDVHLMGVEPQLPPLGPDHRADRPVPGEQPERGHRIRQPPHGPFQPRRRADHHLAGEPDPDVVGERHVPGDAQVHVDDFAVHQGRDGGFEVRLDPHGPGEVVGGAERQHPERHVPVCQHPPRGADRPVPAPGDQQVGLFPERFGDQPVQPAGLLQRIRPEQLEPGLDKPPPRLFVEEPPPPGPRVDNKNRPPPSPDVSTVLPLTTHPPTLSAPTHPTPTPRSRPPGPEP